VPSAYYCDLLYFNLCILSYLKFPCSHFEGKGNAIQSKSIPAVKTQALYTACTAFTTFCTSDMGLINSSWKLCPYVCHLRSAESLNGIKLYSVTWLIYSMFSHSISPHFQGAEEPQPGWATLL